MFDWKASGRLWVLALGAMTPVTLFAQATSSGSVSGVVVGPDGAVVPGATVELDLPGSTPRFVTSDAEGAFVLRGLPSGDYELQAKAAGFATSPESPVSVAVGRTAEITIKLALSAAKQSVTVSATQGTLDTTQTSSVVNIDRDRVEELPIPSRNYLTFVLLSPQVASANPALFPQGTPPVGGSFSFGGLRPGSNAIYLDDTNDNDEFSGGSRTQLSPEAISDFQIVNHGFQAQSGGGAGGSIDVQTRLGSDVFHGDDFIFVQNSALNAIQPLGLYPYKPDETRLRVGSALGGPLQKGKTFFYYAAEQEMAHGEDANDLKPATLSAINGATAKYAPLNAVTLKSGMFATEDQETELSARIDHNFSQSESAMLRYAETNGRNVNDAYDTNELADRTARGSSFVDDNSLNGRLSSLFSPKQWNDLSFEVAQRRAVDRTEQTTGPGVLIAGVAQFGTPFSGNDRRFETHVEVADSLSVQHKKHLMTFGVREDHVGLRASVPDSSQGFFVFDSLASLQAGTPQFFARSYGNFNTNLAELRFAAFAQDHWTPTKRLAVDYGARYEFNHLPSPLPQDWLNVSPRLGVAWTAHKGMVVRSGFGIFYDRYELSTANRLLEMNGTRSYMQIVEDAAAQTVWNSGQAPVAPMAGVAPSVWRSAAKLTNPYSEVASFSVEQELPLQTTLKGEYQYVHGVHLGRTANVNLLPPTTLTAGNAASLGVSSPTEQQLGRPVFSAGRVDPRYDAVNEFSTTAGSSYNGVTVSLNRQFQDNLEVLAGYTYSKTMDDASYDFEQPQNPYDPAAERALSLEDQRQRLTLSGLWLIGPDLDDPADAAAAAHPSTLMKIMTGFEFTPILSISSGYRANPVTGVDSNHEHIFPFAARPLGYARNSLMTPTNVDFDLRALRMVPIWRGHLDCVAESFNLLNHRNVTEINTVYGPGAQAQAGFGKAINTSTARRVQFSLDYEF